MADLGFWAIAADDPGHLALVEADGRETSAGDLLAGANQLARGLQAAGLQKGDVIAALLPNEREMVELALGATQIGLYLTPINYHLTGPEVAYIVDNSEAKVFVTSGRYGDVDPDTAFGMASLLLSLFGIQPKGDNVHLVPAPLYHTAAMTFGLNSLHMGHTVVLMDKWGAEPTLALGERYRCTTSHMVPTM